MRETFDAEFRGLFFGEGCLDLQRLTRNPRSLTPRARIGLHEKDLPTLLAVQARFGGRLYYRTANTSWTWNLTGQSSVLQVLDVLEAGEMPSAKRRECSILRTAIEWMPARGYNFQPGQAEALAELRVELSTAKREAV